MLEEILNNIIAEKRRVKVAKPVIINYLKEWLQCAVLQKIYSTRGMQDVVFKGGSALRLCHGLPRLSEDVDFDQNIKNFSLASLEVLIKEEIKTKYFSKIETKLQGNKRIYLKFPILKSLGFAERNETDLLLVKIEIENEKLPFADSELIPISKFGFNFVVRVYDLPTLMAGKIRAILTRLWFKGKAQEIDIKGRDFYDLFWFMQKGVKPNYKTLKKICGIGTEKELKEKLKEKIRKNVSPQKLMYDLQNFLENQEFVSDFAKNYQKIMSKYLY